MSVHVGTSGWNYPSGRGTWNGVFYPTRRARGFDELAYYAEHFDTVEVNSTFYRMPEAPMVRRWADRTPPAFLFSIKLFQKFTHPDMYLARAGASEWNLSASDADLFRAGIDPLASADRLAAVLIQFPPSFHAMPETRGYLDWLLRLFSGYPIAIELRHRSWSDEAQATSDRLAAARAAWARIDEPKFASSIRQGDPAAPLDAVSQMDPSVLCYLRLHGRNRAEWWDHSEAEDRYDYLYSSAELAPFAGAATAASSHGQRVLVYMNNHFSAKAVANAAILKYQLGDLVPGTYSTAMVERYPELRGIVTADGLAY